MTNPEPARNRAKNRAVQRSSLRKRGAILIMPDKGMAGTLRMSAALAVHGRFGSGDPVLPVDHGAGQAAARAGLRDDREPAAPGRVRLACSGPFHAEPKAAGPGCPYSVSPCRRAAGPAGGHRRAAPITPIRRRERPWKEDFPGTTARGETPRHASRRPRLPEALDRIPGPKPDRGEGVLPQGLRRAHRRKRPRHPHA